MKSKYTHTAWVHVYEMEKEDGESKEDFWTHVFNEVQTMRMKITSVHVHENRKVVIHYDLDLSQFSEAIKIGAVFYMSDRDAYYVVQDFHGGNPVFKNLESDETFDENIWAAAQSFRAGVWSLLGNTRE